MSRKFFCPTISGLQGDEPKVEVIYKAAAIGLSVELINLAFTSQTCHHCLKLGSCF